MAVSSRSKVKTGCRTCKVRKVKCDEGRPACRRCESTGRVCDGYGIWGGGSKCPGLQQDQPNTTADGKCLKRFASRNQSNIAKHVHILTLEASEKASFEWFMTRSALKLPGAFYSRNWTALLFQASTIEPSIRHAMLALSSAHREEVLEFHPIESPKDCTEYQALFTTRQYNLAISNLQPCFTENNSSNLHILLITCILFASTEFLRGHFKQGVLHLEHGLSLLQENSRHSAELPHSTSTYIDGWIITLFTRFLVQAKILGQVSRTSCRSFIGLRLTPYLDTFKSPHHARRSLESIMLRSFDLEEKSNELVNFTKCNISYELTLEKEANRVELQKWFHVYTNTLSKIPTARTDLLFLAYMLLGLYYYLTTILVDTCLSHSGETKYDRCQKSFTTIISRCMNTYKLVFPDGKRNYEFQRRVHGFESYSGDSVSDIGWISPLYFTAIKCRNHYIRHMATHLLSLKANKEGVWDSVWAVVVARKVIEIEEAGFYDDLQIQDSLNALALPTAKDLATPVLPETHRIGNLNIMLPEDRYGKVVLCCCRPSGDTLEWISQEYSLTSCEWKDTVTDLGKGNEYSSSAQTYERLNSEKVFVNEKAVGDGLATMDGYHLEVI